MSAALYLFFRDNRSIPPVVPLVATAIGFAISIAPLPDPIKYSAGTFLIAFGLATIHRAWSLVNRLLSNSFLKYLGIWSFSLYLWQQPFGVYWHHFHPHRTLLLALILTIAVLSFYAVERQVRRFLNNAFPQLRLYLSQQAVSESEQRANARRSANAQSVAAAAAVLGATKPAASA